jgi:hypothetical protein
MAFSLSSRAPLETPSFTGASQTLGAEIITNQVNRDFSGPCNWDTNQSSWELADGAWTNVIASLNTALDLAYCNVAPVIGQYYQITATITTTQPGRLIAGFGGAYSNQGSVYYFFTSVADGGTSYLPLGTFTCTAIVSALNTTEGGYLWAPNEPTGTWMGSIDNISIKPITYTAGLSTEYLSAADASFSDPNNWAGTDWTNGVHDVATAEPYTLANTYIQAAPVVDQIYQVYTYKESTTQGLVTVSFGGVSFTLPVTQDYGYALNVKAISTDPLTITPDEQWTGSITEASVRLVTPSEVILSVNTNNAVAIAARSTFQTNFAIGVDALRSFPTGEHNVGYGYGTLRDTVKPNYNTAIGGQALMTNTIGYDNTAVGYNAIAYGADGRCNTAVGSRALTNTNRGNYNTAIGCEALEDNTEGYNNTALGYRALNENITGEQNIGVGSYAMRRNTAGVDNVSIGYFSLEASTAGDQNVAVGNNAMPEVNGTSQNTAIGHHAYASGSYTNTTCIGFDSNPTGDNQVILGDANITGVYSAGQFFSAGFVLARKVDVPASATAAGLVGDFAADTSYMYICVDTDTWKRVAIASW